MQQSQSGEPVEDLAASSSKLSKETYIKYLRHKAGVVEGKKVEEDSQDRRREDPRQRRSYDDSGGSRQRSSSSRDDSNSYGRRDSR
ncbi:MAG: hypothetical protein WDW38_000069 [Sanguina aurantia]